MADSVVQICCEALALVGSGPIESLAEGNKRARLCNQHYQPVVDSVLRAHPWNCATFRRKLTLNAGTPPFGFEHQFDLPVDPYCLRAVHLHIPNVPWKIEGRLLLTDLAEVYLLYVGRVSNPILYDSLLVTAIAARLASMIAVPLIQDEKAMKSMMELFEYCIRQARGVDGMEGTNDPEPPGTWEMALRGVR